MKKGRKSSHRYVSKTGHPRPQVSGWDINALVPRGMPGSGYFMMTMWPIFLLAAVSGVAFDLVKWVISNIRRHVYNRNRNRKYAETKHEKKKVYKNMTWRKKSPRKPMNRVRPSPPPQFAGDLYRQWDKVHDSLEEMIRFGEMMIELEDYVDNSFIFDHKGDIVGRQPGIKGFLEEGCPHIGYKTAMRYRILAMKAQETDSKIHAQCHTMCELEKKFDTALGVPHRRLENPCLDQRRKKRNRTPQDAIYSIREVAHSVTGKLDTPRRRRVVAALLEIARELSAS